MGLALLWVCVSNMHSIISVGWIGAKIDFGRSQGGVGVDIFSVLDLRVSTWVTYSPQDSVQRLLLSPPVRTVDDSLKILPLYSTEDRVGVHYFLLLKKAKKKAAKMGAQVPDAVTIGSTPRKRSQ
jgi:hypothetical protein